MDYLIIGTAGHVDHGKTALVQALTGVDTDRLAEEKKRGITIELGFAKWQLNDRLQAGIIDVPGHERFIKNMLAGAGGIDLVLMIIAADEGVMPQTKEHLAILDLLGIEKGLVVITKCDLVDEEWLGLIEEEVKEVLEPTFLASSPLLRVSAKTGLGLERLQEEVIKLALEKKEKQLSGALRMPVDRVFSLVGFGTVVTGTLLAGELKTGDTVELLPSAQKSRVRSLQVHGQKADKVSAGHRTAVNLTDLDVADIKRGMVLVEPNKSRDTCYLDVKLHLLSTASHALKHRERIRFYLGAAEVMGRVYLLDLESLEPGDSGFAQLRLEERIFALSKDRFVLRSYSPLETIGGGLVLDPHPKQHKRFRSQIIKDLELKETGSAAECLEQECLSEPGLMRTEKDFSAPLGEQEKLSALQELTSQGRLLKLDKYYLPQLAVNRYAADLKELLHKFHQECPWKKGYPKELARSKKASALKNKQFQLLLDFFVQQGWLSVQDDFLRLKDYQPVWRTEDLAAKEKIKAVYREAGFAPPDKNTVLQGLSLPEQTIHQALLDLGELVLVNENLIFLPETLELGKKLLRENFKGEFTAADFRNLIKSSRKYVIPLLEYYDGCKITRRQGDKRVLI